MLKAIAVLLRHDKRSVLPDLKHAVDLTELDYIFLSKLSQALMLEHYRPSIHPSIHIHPSIPVQQTLSGLAL